MELVSRASKIDHGHDLIDWASISGMDEITTKLCGDISYWRNEEFKGINPRDIEIKILRSVPRNRWYYEKPYGKHIWQHMLTLGKILTPSRDIMPDNYDLVQAMCLNYATGGKAVHLIGAQSRGKSFIETALSTWLAPICPDSYLVFVASPFDNISDTGAWGELVSLMAEMFEAHPDLFPNHRIYKDREIILDTTKSKDFKFGRLMVRGVDSTAKFRGLKSKRKDTGFIFVIADEVNLFKNYAYTAMYSNVIANHSFMSITSHNWGGDDNLASFICAPDKRYGGVASYDELDIDKDQCWDGWGKSIVFRLDGLKSVNILAGKTLTPYEYFDQDNLDTLLEIYGEGDPEYLSQGRAFPATGESARTILSKSKIDKSDWQREFWQPIETPKRYSFVDPSFGGGDDAIWGYICVGKCRYTDADGDSIEEELIWMEEPMRKIKFTNGATYVHSKGDTPDYWKQQVMKAGIPTALFHEEDEHGNPTEIELEEQLVIQCAIWNKEYGIDNRDMAYDSSMRPTIVDTMTRLLGSPRDGGARYIDYNTKPRGYWCEAMRQNTEDFCVNHVDELAFLTAGLFQTRRIRGGRFMAKAVEELCITRWESKTNSRKKVENKKELKLRNRGKSPDRRDCLMGLVAQVYFGGFGKKPSATNSKNTKSGGKNYWGEANKKHRFSYGLQLHEV